MVVSAVSIDSPLVDDDWVSIAKALKSNGVLITEPQRSHGSDMIAEPENVSIIYTTVLSSLLL